MKKSLPFIAILFFSFSMFSQMTLVPGQSVQGLIPNETVKANEDVGFAFYYSENFSTEIYVIENGLAEEVVWEDSTQNFNPSFRGQLGDKYYFFSVFENDGFLYEYDHITKDTRKIPLPANYSCQNLQLLTDELDGKIHFACGMVANGDKAILSFDGTSFESFATPQNHSIFNENYLYSEAMDKIFIWYYDGSETKLYSFDGNELNHIPNPSNDMVPGVHAALYNNQILLPYVTTVDGNDFIFSLYKYENSNLVEIPGFPSSVFHEIEFYEKENKVYISLNNTYDLTSSLFEYDGSSLSEIGISSYYAPTFLTEFDGKDIFSFFDLSLNKATLQSYTGGSLEEITFSQNVFDYYSGATILNNKLYLGAFNNSGPELNELLRLNPGENQLEIVSNLPEDANYLNFQLKANENFLIHILQENGENKLYAQNMDEQFFLLDPDSYSLDRFLFQLGNKTYFSFFDSEWISHVFVWDGVLNTPIFNESQNDIVFHPNPATDFITAEMPSNYSSSTMEVSIFSIDGKMISKQEFQNTGSQLEISLENLGKGIYILELKSQSTFLRKKILKK